MLMQNAPHKYPFNSKQPFAADPPYDPAHPTPPGATYIRRPSHGAVPRYGSSHFGRGTRGIRGVLQVSNKGEIGFLYIFHSYY